MQITSHWPRLANAYPATVAETLAGAISRFGVASLEYEATLSASKPVRAAAKEQARTYLVSYIRTMASSKKRVRFESATKLDAFLGDKTGLGKDPGKHRGQVGFGVEAKFTADIDHQTTYSPHRNQIARIIEAGNSRFKEFFFLLVAPRCYRNARSRLFVYKMEEYLGD